MARWITVTKAPFNFKWPNVTAYTHVTENGEYYVKDELADFAVSKGYATEGKASQKPEPKPARKKATAKRKPAKVAVDAPDTPEPAAVDREDLAADGGADDQPAVADAG